MGVSDLFDKDLSDLNKMSLTPTFLGKLIQVGSIEVDENGTVATVVTSGYPQTTSAESYIEEIINRPFAFEIYEASTGTVLLQGRINNL